MKADTTHGLSVFRADLSLTKTTALLKENENNW